MILAPDPLEAVRWEHHEVAVYSGLDLPSCATFRREVVLAAVEPLDTKIDALENSEKEV